MRGHRRGGLVLLTTAMLSGPAAWAAGEPRVIDAVRAAPPPKLDGKLDDACWKSAKPVTDFVVLDTDRPASAQTIAHVAFDDTHLYIAMNCLDANPKSITATSRPHDSDVFRDDGVEIMIAPTPGSDPYYQLVANAAGATFDCRRSKGGAAEDDGWDGHWQAAVSINPDGWSIEMAIPFNGIDMSEKVGAAWGLNLCRRKMVPREESSTSPMGQFNRLDKFPTLRGLEVNFRKYLMRIGPVRAALRFEAGKPKLDYAAAVANETGKPATVIVEQKDKNGQAVKQEPLKLEPGQKAETAIGSVEAAAQRGIGVARFVPTGASPAAEIVIRDEGTKEVLSMARLQYPSRVEGLRIRIPEGGVPAGQALKVQITTAADAKVLAASTLKLEIRGQDGADAGVKADVAGSAISAGASVPTEKLPWGCYTVTATLADAAGAAMVSAQQSFCVMPGGKEAVEVLSNLVSELANGQKRGTLDQDKIEFLNPRNGWIFVSLDAEGKVDVKLDAGTAAIAAEKGSAEAMRWLPAGRHSLSVARSAGAKVKQLVVRAIPELHYSQYPANPHVTPLGPYDWAFLGRHVLPHINTIMASASADYKAEIDQWTGHGRKWIVHGMLPGIDPNKPADAAECYRAWTSTIGMTDPRMGGVIVDEFGGQSASQYEAYIEAVSRIAADPKFKGKWIHPYCAPIYGTDAGHRFMQTVLEAGYAFAFERYFPEQRTEDLAREWIKRELIEQASAWEEAIPGAIRQMIVVLAYMSQPTESCNINPGVDFKVFMDMQMQTLANEPVFRGLYGIQWYLSSYADEETVRWAARLYRHYAIEGNKDRGSKDPYMLPHLANGDFEQGAEGWTVKPAEEGSVRPHKMGGYSWLQGRYPQTSQGDTFLLARRSGKAPNVISQTIKSLTPGRLYSFKMFTADYGDLSAGKSDKKPSAVSVRFEGAEELADRGFQFSVPNCYSHELGPFNASHNAWMNYHWRIFRAGQPTAKLVITDWTKEPPPAPATSQAAASAPATQTRTAADVGGPLGQETMINFIEVQPYFE